MARFTAGDAGVDALGVCRSARGVDRCDSRCRRSADPRRGRGASRADHVVPDPLSVVGSAADGRDAEDVRGEGRRKRSATSSTSGSPDRARDGAPERASQARRSAGCVLDRRGDVHVRDGRSGRSKRGRPATPPSGRIASLHGRGDCAAAVRPPLDLLSRARTDGAAFLAGRHDLVDAGSSPATGAIRSSAGTCSPAWRVASSSMARWLLFRLMPLALGDGPPAPAADVLDFITGGGVFAGALVRSVPNGLSTALFLVFCYALGRQLLRRDFYASTAVVVLLSAADRARVRQRRQHRLGVDVHGLPVDAARHHVARLRHAGERLLTFAMNQFFDITPLTFDFHAWYAYAVIWTFALIAALVIYGYTISRAGQPLFGRSLLGEHADAYHPDLRLPGIAPVPAREAVVPVVPDSMRGAIHLSNARNRRSDIASVDVSPALKRRHSGGGGTSSVSRALRESCSTGS